MLSSGWGARLRSAIGFLGGAFGRRAQDDDLADEIRFHIEQATERNIRAGMTRDDARRAALVTFGGRTRWTESARDEQRSPWLDDFARDLHYGVGALRRRPVFAASAIATIGLAIAASVTVFSFINSIYLRPLAVPEGARLVRIYAGDRVEFDRQLGYPAFEIVRRSARSFDMVAAHYSTAPLYMSARGESDEAMGAVVSAEYFRMLGIQPALGRFFAASEDIVPDRDAVAVIGYARWQRQFGGDSGVIGEHVTINGRVFTIVGVAPKDFEGVVAGWGNDLWIPAMMMRTGYRWCDGFKASCAVTAIIARLAPSANLSSARAEMSALAPRILAATAPADSMKVVTTMPALGVPTWQQREFTQLSTMLSVIAAILLSIACANLSGMLLARGLARQHELALRVSLGAGRWRIARQLLTESLVIAASGGVVGVMLSLWTSRVLVGFFRSDDEGYLHRYDVALDGKVLGFGVLASLIAVIAFGLFPALRASRVDISETLKRGGGATPRSRARLILVAAQVTLSLVLLIGAGLLTRSFNNVMTRAAFDPSNIAIMRLRPRLIQYSPERAQAYVRAALAAMRQTAGVIAAVPVAGSLINQNSGRAVVSLPGETPPPNAPRLEYFEIGPLYLKTLGVPLLAGREFTETDGPGAPPVAIVTELMAKRLWLDGNVVGRSLVVGGKLFRVVGLVKDYRWPSIGEPQAPVVITPYWQSNFEPQVDARVIIRVEGDPLRALETLRRTVAAVDPRVPVTETIAMEDQMRARFTEVRLGGAVLIAGAAIALFLSGVGLYGVVSFLVTQRSREIGVRLAVGARPTDVVALVIRQGMRPIWIGGCAGLATSLVAAPMLSRWLFAVEAFDWPTTTAAVLAVGLVALLASYFPARRASRTNPALVFRAD